LRYKATITVAKRPETTHNGLL